MTTTRKWLLDYTQKRAANYSEAHRQDQPIVCQTCRGLGFVIVELYDPATGKTVGVSSIDCFKCKRRKE